MTARETLRRVVCAGCGAAFDCTGTSDCWCADVPVRLPMPRDGGDCLCAACLRTETDKRAAASS